MSYGVEQIRLVDGEAAIIDLDQVRVPDPGGLTAPESPGIGITLDDFYPEKRKIAIYGPFDSIDGPAGHGVPVSDSDLDLKWTDPRHSWSSLEHKKPLIPQSNVLLGMDIGKPPFPDTNNIIISALGYFYPGTYSFLQLVRSGSELAITLHEDLTGMVAFQSLQHISDLRNRRPVSAASNRGLFDWENNPAAELNEAMDDSEQVERLRKRVNELAAIMEAAHISVNVDIETIPLLRAARLPLDFGKGLSAEEKIRHLNEQRRSVGRLFHQDAVGEGAGNEAKIKAANAAIDALLNDIQE